MWTYEFQTIEIIKYRQHSCPLCFICHKKRSLYLSHKLKQQQLKEKELHV